MPKWWVLVGRAFRCLPLNQIMTIFLYSHQLVNYKFMHIYRYIFTMCLPVCETSTTGPGHQTWSGWGEKDRDRTKSGGFRGRSKGEDKSKLMRQNMECLPANSGSLYGNFHIWCYLVRMITSFFVLLVGVCIEVCVLEGFKCIVWRMLKLPMVRLLIHTFITDFLRREKETGPGSPPLSGHHRCRVTTITWGNPVELGDAK